MRDFMYSLLSIALITLAIVASMLAPAYLALYIHPFCLALYIPVLTVCSIILSTNN